MVITSLQEKENRKFYVPIRPGNRGGWSLFQWQSVREMPYRDRQMYLGNSAVIGVLDKGGKWRKRDWYLKTQKTYDDPNLTSQQQQAIRKDMERMNYALGRTQMQDQEKLTQQQMQQLLKRIKNKDKQQEHSKDSIGLGFDKTKVQIRAKPGVGGFNPNRLEGIDQIQQHRGKQTKKQHKQIRQKKQHKKHRHRNQQQSQQRSESKERKKKKIKKQKKQKKQKHRKSRSRSKSYEKQQKRRDRSVQKDKKHKKQKSHKKHSRRSRSRS